MTATRTRKKKGGRPLTFTPKLAGEVISAVERGVPLRQAAALAGVSDALLHMWLRFGRDGKEQKYVDFEREVYRASAICVDITVKRLNEAAEEDWRAGAWLLERTHPREFGKHQTVAVQAVPPEQQSAKAGELVLALVESIAASEGQEAAGELLESAKSRVLMLGDGDDD